MNKNMKARLAEWIAVYRENNYLHGSILVANKGEILLNQGFGMSSFEYGVPNRKETKYRIGSITKSFTAMAIYMLQEQNKVNINDSISKYLPTFPLGDKITIHHCLTHSSGIVNFTSSPDFWGKTMRMPLSKETIIDSVQDLPLEFEPGTDFSYSNTGYLVLTSIIEKITGMDYARFIKESILLPLEMHHTGCDDGVGIVQNLASGYSFQGEPIKAPYADLTFPTGAYGLYSTTEDLHKWDQAIRTDKLINNHSSSQMLSTENNIYASGWFTTSIINRPCYHHFGDISGYVNDMICFEDGLSIIFLSNMNIMPVQHLSREIAALVLETDYRIPDKCLPISINPEIDITGKYNSENREISVFISKEENEYFLTVPKDYGVLYKFPLIPIKQGKHTLIFKTSMIDETLVVNFSEDQVNRILYTNNVGYQFNLIKNS